MTTKAAILIDFDNIFSSIWTLDKQLAMRFGNSPSVWLPELAGRHLALDQRRWLVSRCYLNPAGWVEAPDEPKGRLYFSRFRHGLVRAGFEVIDCPSMTKAGNNAADIRIVIDTLDLLRSDCRYEEFVVASGDSDFTPLLQRLRADDRLITILAPGPSSPAYTSLADQIIGFEAIGALVDPRSPPDEVALAPMTIVRSAAGQDSRLFGEFVRAKYESSPEALNLATLAQQVVRALPGSREDAWQGAGSFSAAITRLQLPNARLSHHFLWDEERHQAPMSPIAEADEPDAVAALANALNLPRLDSSTWPKVFAVLARYAGEQSFALGKSTAWTRDELAKCGVIVGRPALNFVVRGAQFGGAALDRSPPPSGNEIGMAFFKNLINLADRNGISLDPDAEVEIGTWLGLAVAFKCMDAADNFGSDRGCVAIMEAP